MTISRSTLAIIFLSLNATASADTLYLNGWLLENVFTTAPGSYVTSGSLIGSGSYAGTVSLESNNPAAITYTGDWMFDVMTGTISTSNANCSMSANATVDGCVGLFQNGSYSTNVAVTANNDGGYNAVWEENNSISNVNTFVFGVTDAPLVGELVDPPPPPPVPLPPAQTGPSYNLNSWSLSNIFVPDGVSLNFAEGSLSGNTLLTGDVSLSDTEIPGGMEYSATWAIDLLEGKLYAEDVSCVDTGPFEACAEFISSGTVSDLDISVNNDGSIDFSWVSETSTIGNVYSFGIASVPVPSAAWLFSSALIGLTGIKRKK